MQEEAKNQSLTMAQRDVAGRTVGPGVPQQGIQQGGMIPGWQGVVHQQQQQKGMGTQQQKVQQQQNQWNNRAILPGMAMQGQMQGGHMQCALPIATIDADVPAFSFSESMSVPKVMVHENGAKSTHPAPALLLHGGIDPSWQQQAQPWEGAGGWQPEGTGSANSQ